jgi:hypothetical protein
MSIVVFPAKKKTSFTFVNSGTLNATFPDAYTIVTPPILSGQTVVVSSAAPSFNPSSAARMLSFTVSALAIPGVLRVGFNSVYVTLTPNSGSWNLVFTVGSDSSSVIPCSYTDLISIVFDGASLANLLVNSLVVSSLETTGLGLQTFLYSNTSPSTSTIYINTLYFTDLVSLQPTDTYIYGYSFGYTFVSTPSLLPPPTPLYAVDTFGSPFVTPPTIGSYFSGSTTVTLNSVNVQTEGYYIAQTNSYTGAYLTSIGATLSVTFSGADLTETPNNSFHVGFQGSEGITAYTLTRSGSTVSLSSFNPSATYSVYVTVYVNDIASAPSGGLPFVIAEPFLKRSTTPTVLAVSASASLPFTTNQAGDVVQLSLSDGFSDVSVSSVTVNVQSSIPSPYALLSTVILPLAFTLVGTVNVTPTLVSPLQLYTYQPFSYTFTTPDAIVGAVLTSTSSSVLTPYITLSSDASTLVFADSVGFRASTTGASLEVSERINGSNVTTSKSIVNVVESALVITPTLPSNTGINLYKYEPFSYVFSITGVGNTLTLRYTNSSSQLRVYSTLSTDGKTFTFAGTPVASYTSTFALIVDLMNGSTVVNTSVFPVTIGTGRVVTSIASPYALNQYENISNTFGSNIVLTAANSPTVTLSVPTLPLGLSFYDAYTIIGTPQVQQPLRTYQLIASNSLNGSISTTNIGISVGPPVVRITPFSVSFTNLNTTSTPTATFTSLLPNNPYGYTFQYLLPVLPSGLFFTDISNNPLPGGFFFTPTDAAKTVNLAGTPDMTDARGFPSSGVVNVQLAGYFKDATNVQTIGTASLSFQFAETVLMTTTVSSNLYVGKALGSNDVVLTAASYFPSTSPIDTLVYSGLPAGLSLAGGAPWYLTGTPTTAGTTSNTLTATNLNGLSNTTPLVITINPDIVTFTQTPGNQSYIVSLPLASNAFQVQASATSGSVVSYSSSLNFSLYGLTFNTTTGVLSGVPLSNLSTTQVTFTATDTLGASATYSPYFTILRDVFTWPSYTPTYFQNRTITPFQIVVSTLSGRAIQSFSSTGMPPGLSLSSSGLITGTFTGSTSGTFTVSATTGYQAPATTASQTYSYSAIADNLLILQNNGIDPISNTFSNIPFTTIQYSSDMIVYPAYSVTNIQPPGLPLPILTMSPSGLFSGDFTGIPTPAATYYADIVATYAGVTSTATVTLALSAGKMFIPPGTLTFTQPTQSNFVLYQHVPYTIPIAATGTSSFIYYYASGLPVGLQFDLDPTGTTATISGRSSSNGLLYAIVYAKTGSSAAVAYRLSINTVLPYFTKPQLGAGAYTAIVREHVDADAAQNGRDAVVYPQVNPLAGPFAGPRAPDVVTQTNCFLKLCKKPCPTCRSTM